MNDRNKLSTANETTHSSFMNPLNRSFHVYIEFVFPQCTTVQDITSATVVWTLSVRLLAV